MVEFADFNHAPIDTPMTGTNTDPSELLAKYDLGDFLCAIAEAVLQRGKAPKLAITAIMRKLVLLANALLRDGRKWADRPA